MSKLVARVRGHVTALAPCFHLYVCKVFSTGLRRQQGRERWLATGTKFGKDSKKAAFAPVFPSTTAILKNRNAILSLPWWRKTAATEEKDIFFNF